MPQNRILGKQHGALENPQWNGYNRTDISRWANSIVAHVCKCKFFWFSKLEMQLNVEAKIVLFPKARNPTYAQEGIDFMQEMVEVSKLQAKQAKTLPLAVAFRQPGSHSEVTFPAGPAHFGPVLRGSKFVLGEAVLAVPSTACTELTNGNLIKGKIAIVYRGDCVFVQKVRVYILDSFIQVKHLMNSVKQWRYKMASEEIN